MHKLQHGMAGMIDSLDCCTHVACKNGLVTWRDDAQNGERWLLPLTRISNYTGIPSL